MSIDVVSLLKAIDGLNCSKHQAKVTHVCINSKECEDFFLCEKCLKKGHSCRSLFVKTLPGIKGYLLQGSEHDNGARCREKMKKIMEIMAQKSQLKKERMKKEDEIAKNQPQPTPKRKFFSFLTCWCGSSSSESQEDQTPKTQRIFQNKLANYYSLPAGFSIQELPGSEEKEEETTQAEKDLGKSIETNKEQGAPLKERV